MNGYYNEDMAWQRLQDIQREMENRRIVAGGGPSLAWWPVRLAQRAWILAGLTAQRPPRFSAKLAGKAPRQFDYRDAA